MENINMELLRLEDGEYYTTLPKKYCSRKRYEAEDKGSVFSAIPGTIVEICVSDGQKVSKGEDLFVLDSMKMNNRITAPADGVIKTVHVHVGQSVGKNFRMLEYV
jgi:biotin carboxyl carrier protein